MLFHNDRCLDLGICHSRVTVAVHSRATVPRVAPIPEGHRTGSSQFFFVGRNHEDFVRTQFPIRKPLHHICFADFKTKWFNKDFRRCAIPHVKLTSYINRGARAQNIDTRAACTEGTQSVCAVAPKGDAFLLLLGFFSKDFFRRRNHYAC